MTPTDNDAVTAVANRDSDATASAAVLTSTEPVGGALVAEFPVDGEPEVRAAVARAQEAAAWWREEGFDGRARCLLAWRAEIGRGAEELVDLIHRENGKTRDAARTELLQCLGLIAWAAANAPRVLGSRAVETPYPHLEGRVEYRPYGVVGVIGPWNFPAMTPMGIIAFALAAGNAVVFKPSEVTPAVGRWLADAWTRAVPDGPVLQVVLGFGATGEALVRGGVDKVAFTGSVRTGQGIMSAAAAGLTPMLLELGGNDAAVVLADADLDAAAEAIVWGAFANTGLGCVAIERAIVVSAVHDAFVERVVERTRAIRGAREEAPQLGAVPVPGHVETIRRHVEDALERGARVVAGDPTAFEPPYAAPIVLVDVPRDALIAREETFGPTLAILEVPDADAAIAAANDTPYGLGSAVFSHEHWAEVAGRLRAGMTSVNSTLAFATIPGLPFGGGGGVSGFGRKHGDEGLLEFARPQAVAIKCAEPRVDAASFSAPSGLLEEALARASAAAIREAESLAATAGPAAEGGR